MLTYQEKCEQLGVLTKAELLKEQLMRYRLANGWHVGSDKDEAVYNFLIQELIEVKQNG
jgi:hypothetical protein|tara:strand:- start:127 stop:303 length:177 start_codon:yes stop_codon:yes gene_type:complete